jgi:hypothetical protein
MASQSTDLVLRLSGGAANTDPNASLGGAISTTEWSSAIFDDVSSAEGAAGDVEYRCVYFHNPHATLTALGTKVWIKTNTPSPDTALTIGAGTAAAGTSTTEQTVADENTAPSGVTFSAAANEAGAVVLGDIAPGARKALWLKRDTTAGAAAYNDSFALTVKCETYA